MQVRCRSAIAKICALRGGGEAAEEAAVTFPFEAALGAMHVWNPFWLCRTELISPCHRILESSIHSSLRAVRRSPRPPLECTRSTVSFSTLLSSHCSIPVAMHHITAWIALLATIASCGAIVEAAGQHARAPTARQSQLQSAAASLRLASQLNDALFTTVFLLPLSGE